MIIPGITIASTIFIVWMRNRYSKMRNLMDQWKAKQNEYRKRIREEDDDDATEPRLIGGVDISFIKGDNVNACACIVVVSYPDIQVVHTMCRMIHLPAPYVSGFLAFRECDSLLDMIKDLKRLHSNFVPDIIMVDGNGVLHPRGVGTCLSHCLSLLYYLHTTTNTQALPLNSAFCLIYPQ